MRGIILAAGRGERLSGVTGSHPKCLARVGSVTLIERQIRTLRECGIRAITVVTGHHAADVRHVCGSGIDFVHNSRHESTNSLCSLWLARHALGNGFVVLNCDVLFHPQLILDLLTARFDDAVLVEARPDGVEYTDEEMKVRVRRGRVIDIAKTIPAGEADGENVGIAKFGPAGAGVLVEEMTRLLGSGGARSWLPSAFAVFSLRRPLHVVDSRGFPWIEIDFPEDYWRACTDVLPAIEAETGGDDLPDTTTDDATAAAAAPPRRPLHV
jgi:choline kinase